MPYGSKTKVGADRTQQDIKQMLYKFGADGFSYGEDAALSAAMISFRMRSMVVRIIAPLPHPDDREFAETSAGRRRPLDQGRAMYEQAVNARWRQLWLLIKARLEAVEAGIVAFEEEFAPDIVMPNGMTVRQFYGRQLHQALAAGKLPPLLPGASGE